MNIAGLISGFVLTSLGIILLVIGFFNLSEPVGIWIIFFYGIIALGIGIYILLNLNKEDKIEQIKTNKNSK
jgi:uncharacterized membrane protein HdeD (DUF308 family)